MIGRLPFLCCATVTAISALVSLAFTVAAIRAANGEKRSIAYYAGARSSALAIASLAAFAAPSPWLEAVATCMIIVQAMDAVIGAAIRSPMKTFGPAATASFNGVALAWLICS